MTKQSAELVQWSNVVRDMPVTELAISMPIHVLFGEAVDLAKFFEKYWASKVDENDVVVRPGLESVAKKGKKKPGSDRDIDAKTGDDLLSLQRAAQEAHSEYLMSVRETSDVDPMGRGQFLASEINGVLGWYLDDGVADEHDERLARVQAAHANDPDTADALALKLDDFAMLAEQYRKEIDGLGGFSAAYIDEAREIAAALRETPNRTGSTNDGLVLRNKLVNLLMSRMSAVRAAARFVFRDRPEIAREATSAYRRKQQNSRRANAKDKATAPKSDLPAMAHSHD